MIDPVSQHHDQGQPQIRIWLQGNEKVIYWSLDLLASLPSGTLNHVGTEEVDRKPSRPVTIGSAVAKGMEIEGQAWLS